MHLTYLPSGILRIIILNPAQNPATATHKNPSRRQYSGSNWTCTPPITNG